MKVRRRSVSAALASLPAWAHAQDTGNERAPLIPIETLFKAPAYRNLRLSRNGRFMAATVPMFDRQNLVVLDVEKRDAKVLSGMRHADVRSIFWATDERLLYTTGDNQGKEFAGDGGIYAINRDGSGAKELVEPFLVPDKLKFVFRDSTVLGRVAGSTDEVLVSSNDRQFDSEDLFRLNIHTGRKQLMTLDNPGKVLFWVLDREQRGRAALCHDREAKRWWFVYRGVAGGEWKTLAQWNERLDNLVVPYSFDGADPRRMIVQSNPGRDTLAFFRFDPETAQLGDMIVGTERYDMGSFQLVGGGSGGAQLVTDTFDEEVGKVIGVRFQADRYTTAWFEEEPRRLQAALDRALPGRINLFNPVPKKSLVYSYSATDPGSWYLFDREKRALEETGVKSRPWIDPRQMGPVSYVTYAARDGLKIGAYLTLPKGFRKGSPVPFVILPHGGPWVRDVYTFDDEAQFFANRGFAVLKPNFRGSTGYGARHLRASYKQFGAAMTDDIIDGVEWAIREGYADKDRMGAYGASYGGFAVLSVMVKRPELFKWGVNYVGVVDLKLNQDTQPAQLHGDFGPLAAALIGDQRADAAAFEAQSPARHVVKLAAPVLHAYGGRDRNVDFAQGREIRALMDRAGKPYEWIFHGDEGHGFRQTENRLDFYRRVETFVLRHTPK